MWGNHEHFSGFSAWIIALRKSKWRLRTETIVFLQTGLAIQTQLNKTQKNQNEIVNCQFQLLPTFGIICVFKRFVIPFLLWRLMKVEAFWRYSELIARFGLRRLSQALAFPWPKKRRRHGWVESQILLEIFLEKENAFQIKKFHEGLRFSQPLHAFVFEFNDMTWFVGCPMRATIPIQFLVFTSRLSRRQMVYWQGETSFFTQSEIHHIPCVKFVYQKYVLLIFSTVNSLVVWTSTSQMSSVEF